MKTTKHDKLMTTQKKETKPNTEPTSGQIQRLVRVYSYEAVEPDDNDTELIPEHLWDKRLTPEYDGKFLGWGQDSEQDETGGACYTCAIVEKDDGFVALVYAQHVQFIDADSQRCHGESK